jgi:hypothetical protein
MKITKSEFRAMIKECIRELVQEGAFNSVITESVGGNMARMPVAAPDMIRPQTYAAPPAPVVHNPMLSNAIQMATSLVTRARPEEAALYSQILEDTSRTTLQKMIGQENEHRQGLGGLSLPEVQTEINKQDSKGLEALAAIGAGGDMQRWAQVAMGGRRSE